MTIDLNTRVTKFTAVLLAIQVIVLARVLSICRILVPLALPAYIAYTLVPCVVVWAGVRATKTSPAATVLYLVGLGIFLCWGWSGFIDYYYGFLYRGWFK